MAITTISRHVLYVAYIFRKADKLLVDIGDPTKDGWNKQMMVIESSVCYPPDVSKFLFECAVIAILEVVLTLMTHGNAWSFRDDLDYDLEDKLYQFD